MEERNVVVTLHISDEGYAKDLQRRLMRYLKQENERLRDRGCKPLACEFRLKRYERGI